jgi:hypothetical protein
MSLKGMGHRHGTDELGLTMKTGCTLEWFAKNGSGSHVSGCSNTQFPNISHDHIFCMPVDAIMAIKKEYGLTKNWMGDPCFPANFTWDGVKCGNTNGNTTRITSL